MMDSIVLADVLRVYGSSIPLFIRNRIIDKVVQVDEHDEYIPVGGALIFWTLHTIASIVQQHWRDNLIGVCDTFGTAIMDHGNAVYSALCTASSTASPLVPVRRLCITSNGFAGMDGIDGFLSLDSGRMVSQLPSPPLVTTTINLTELFQQCYVKYNKLHETRDLQQRMGKANVDTN